MPNFSFGRYAAPAPTPYHLSIGHLLERRHPKLWAKFESREMRAAAAEEMGLELARRAEPIGLLARPELYEACGEISGAMGLEAPITLYQADAPSGVKRNAALYFEPDHAHVVFEGDLLDVFEAAEIWYVIGHELAHHRLWTAEGGRMWTAHRFLRWAAGERGASEPFKTSARLEKLYTEIFADRYGLWASGDLDAALSAHVKIVAGDADASGGGYLALAEETLAARAASVGGDDDGPPPEPLLRAALLAAWAREPGSAEGRARALIEDAAPLDRLDLLAQERLADITHWMLYEFLDEPWRGRDLVRAHAAQISETLVDALAQPRAEAAGDIDGLRQAISSAHPSIRRYLSYLLLDFATIDPQVEEMMLAAALQFSGDFGLGAAFKAVAGQELKITKTKLSELEKSAGDILTRAELLLGAPPGLRAEDFAPEPSGDPTTGEEDGAATARAAGGGS